MKIRLVIIFVFHLNFCLSQNCSKEECEKLKPEINVEKGDKYKGRKLLSSINKSEVLVSFKEAFSDSIKTFINGKFIRVDFVQSDSIDLGLSNVAFKVLFPNNRTRMKISFISIKDKKCIDFTINKKYRLIKVYRHGEIWRLIKTNYVPIYY